MSKLAQIIDLSFAYEEKPVFEHISMEVNSGEIVCLMGPNGCGKTTLIDNIMAVHKPQAGEILLDGRPVGQYRRQQIAQKIAYVPQSHGITFAYTVKEVVKMGRTAHVGLFAEPSADDEEISLAALDKVGMLGFAERPYSQLSGGEVKMVLLARAIGQGSKMIIMDEPTAHLDFRNELIFLETVTRLVRNEGLAVLMATHSPGHAFYFEAKQVPVRTLLMSKGRVIAEDVPGKVITEDAVARVYGVASRIDSTTDSKGQTMKTITLFDTI